MSSYRQFVQQWGSHAMTAIAFTLALAIYLNVTHSPMAGPQSQSETVGLVTGTD
ncbi:MAG: hypothetical protein AAFR42_20595 [Cyanobacteria bacterium J06628_6]